MALISQNFKNDTVSKNTNINPIILLTNANQDTQSYDVLDAFSDVRVTLESNIGKIETKNILNKISSLKNSVDYESRKLKINTFRFDIYNYYDIKTKLTNSEKYSLNNSGINPSNNFMGKTVILLYKTQSTNKVNLSFEPELGDDECAIIFRGVINRVTQDDQTIKIQAEDNIQSYISDKSVPSARTSELPSNIKNSLINIDDRPIPIIYGDVDRCKAITYGVNYGLGFIHDSKPIFGKFYTWNDGTQGWDEVID